MSEVEEIGEAVAKLGQMLFDRDPRFADQFMPDALLIGSERGEIVAGQEAIRTFISTLFDRPARFIWDWTTVEIKVEGDMGWLFAEGHVVRVDDDGRAAVPYRLSGVLAWDGKEWRWRLFHGSEPKS